MKTLVIQLVFLFIFSNWISFAQTSGELSLPPEKAQWFRDAKFGMFIHWGLYSMLEGAYNGRSLPDASLKNGRSWYAEWVWKRLEVPDMVYKDLIRQFNPVNFDADEWIREAKNAGMRYFAITSKHHDGFALWDTKFSDFNVMNTPYGKDILEQLVRACKKYGIKYGFYYSHWMDWEHPGGANEDWEGVKQPSAAEFKQYWEGKSLPQVKELIEKFDPDFFWFDTWGNEGIHITSIQRDELIRLVRTNSTKCLINGRISYANPGDNVDFIELLDNVYSDKILSKPWQTPATMNRSFGWHANDFAWKSSATMLGHLLNCASTNGNYLLNIGPKPDGTFPAPAVRRLKEMGAWLDANGEAVYETSYVPVEIDRNTGIYLTQKNESGKNYLYISIAKPVEKIELPIGIRSLRVLNARVLETNQTVSFLQSDNHIEITIPQNVVNDCSIVVIKMEMERLL